jgi:transcriptional regulator GlxA family with amidase domain
MLPRGKWHQISGTPELQTEPTLTPKDASGPLTTVLCGLVQTTAGSLDPIISVLPEILVVHAEDQGTSAQLHALARMIMSEYESGGSGGHAVLERLAEIMYVMIVRHYVQSQPQQRGLLAAIADQRLAAALGAIHQNPGHEWQIQELADLAGMSRTAFTQRFKSILETTPMQYVTRWRIHLATDLLSDRRNTVTKIAEQLGYQTEAAFRRAFKRISGSAPGQIRKQAVAST